MSSRDGFARADIDVGLFDDVKVKRLARLQHDPMRTMATMTLYIAAVLESWRENEPQAAADTAPAWVLDDVSDLLADLETVGLLEGGCVRVESLDRWMADVRAAVEWGRAGAAARWSKNATVMPPHKDHDATPLPSQPASTPVQLAGGNVKAKRRGRAVDRPSTEGSAGPRGMKDILREMGYDPEVTQ